MTLTRTGNNHHTNRRRAQLSTTSTGTRLTPLCYKACPNWREPTYVGLCNRCNKVYVIGLKMISVPSMAYFKPFVHVHLNMYRHSDSVLHAAARISSGASRFDRIQPLLHRLSWLPIHARIEHRLANLAFNCRRVMVSLHPTFLAN